MNNSHPINTRSILHAPSVQNHCLSVDEYDFAGFTDQEIRRAKIINEKKVDFLTNKYKLADKNKNDFVGFVDLEISRAKIINTKKIDIIWKEQNPDHPRSFSRDKSCSGLPIRREKAGMNEHRRDPPSRPSNHKKIAGIVNLGNTCYINSVMQCLNCLTPFVNYFEKDKYLKDIQPKSKYNGKLANEICTALRNMNDKAGPISLAGLKGLIGRLCSPFKGSG